MQELTPGVFATGRYIGRCRYAGCKAVKVADRRGAAVPTCHGSAKVEEILATTGKQRECNSVCQGAKGPSCDCKCLGANHGAGWSA